ncbi:hypothetical protein, partial [Acinetobacter baumannii]|uniref:hypothetical protein n=1 Tax=Acinetobacter baumannii TaxID=470 RepID=UPI0013D7A968
MTVAILLIAWSLALAMVMRGRLKGAPIEARAMAGSVAAEQPETDVCLAEPGPFHCAAGTDAAPPHANGRRRAEPTQSDCED